jgi:predicted house-cleaning noncanonical NTP pyrophosphatase (MazG superfamily)
MTRTMGKLIRDRIPEIARDKGETLAIRVATPEEMPALLKAKLVEEAKEFFEKPSIEELGDVLDVLDELGKIFCWPKIDIERARVRKGMNKGRFEKRFVLKSIGEG